MSGRPPRVFLEECRHYDADRIEVILREGIAWLGLVLPRRCLVLVKPNVLGAYPPERHVTTHPAVVEAVFRILKDDGNRIVVGDSSGNGQHGYTRHALDLCGLSALARRYGAAVRSFEGSGADSVVVDWKGKKRTLRLSMLLGEADAIVNVPKMKSHLLTRFTGAVKNLFGCVPGAAKLRCHTEFPEPDSFADLLLSIYSAIAPRIVLNVMDGIVGLDGPGPGPSGKVNPAGLLAASADALALDFEVTRLLGVRPQDIPTNRLAVALGMFDGVAEINRALAPIPFRLPRPTLLAGPLHRIFPRFGMSRPVVLAARCGGCGRCVTGCPRGAVRMVGRPLFDYGRCIYCYCCHENCPEGAIRLAVSLPFRLFKLFEHEAPTASR
jgi:uncharacterized protein (DUF362 family)/Pyruvate/2-oxoacid:ferredoxin oxidoreductase delta subunit